MMTMDGDGNGEVDFEEFLSLMTDTEMFIEALALKVNKFILTLAVKMTN